MLGKLILLQRKVDAGGGQLRLCGLSPSTRAVLKTTNLERLFKICADSREAVEQLQTFE
jgi:anti-anti-sigma regulatory factor